MSPAKKRPIYSDEEVEEGGKPSGDKDRLLSGIRTTFTLSPQLGQLGPLSPDVKYNVLRL